MNPKVRIVKPLAGYRLSIEFVTGERRIFDVTPYLTKGVFQQLRNPGVFDGVKTVAGSVEWPGGIDLSYDTVYLGSTPDGTATAA